METYAYCGHAVRSAIALPELDAAPDAVAPAWTCASDAEPFETGRFVHRWVTDDGDPWLEISRHGSAYTIRFDIGPVFRVEASSIGWSAPPGITDDTLRHLLLDQVLPLAMSAAGEFVLHASAVQVGRDAIVFAGPSGRGKSTLAAACMAAGATLVADDCVRVVRAGSDYHAQPSYPGLRLWDDSVARMYPDAACATVAAYTGKLRVPSRTASRPTPSRRIYLVDRAAASGPRILPAAAPAVVDLLRYVFRIDPHDRQSMAADFSMAASLVARGCVRRLILPDSLAALDAAVSAVHDDAAAARRHPVPA